MTLKSDIRQYILENEAAAETKEGVTRVWLRRSASPEVVSDVESALEELVREQVLERHRLPGGATIYRRARRDED
jgi:hypothetical protein